MGISRTLDKGEDKPLDVANIKARGRELFGFSGRKLVL